MTARSRLSMSAFITSSDTAGDELRASAGVDAQAPQAAPSDERLRVEVIIDGDTDLTYRAHRLLVNILHELLGISFTTRKSQRLPNPPDDTDGVLNLSGKPQR